MFKFDTTEPYADSEFEVRDPSGYVLMLGELIEEVRRSTVWLRLV
jgi:hypothetical protein